MTSTGPQNDGRAATPHGATDGRALPAEPRPLRGLAKASRTAPTLGWRGDVTLGELPTKTLVQRCDAPSLPFDMTLNPYRGCELACVYCYARETHAFLDLSPGDDFERRIFAKADAAKVLREELDRGVVVGSLALGTATDPYQPSEGRLRLTRSLLEVFAERQGLDLSITTKSDLVLRDLDLFHAIGRRNRISVRVTVTTLDVPLARSLEPRAPVPTQRLEAVRALSAAGVATAVNVAPILPWITDSPEALETLVRAAHAAGARDVWGQVLFLRAATRPTFFAWLDANHPGVLPWYRKAYDGSDYLKGPRAASIAKTIGDLRKALEFPGLPRAVRPATPAVAGPRRGQLLLFDDAA